HERLSPELYSEAIAARLRQRFAAEVLEAQVAVFGPPAVEGLGNAGGFKLMVEDRGDASLQTLQAEADKLALAAAKQPRMAMAFNSFRASTPQLYIDVDRVKCKTFKVKLSDVFATLQVYLGGYYVNDFNRFGRTWQVNIQAEAQFRLEADDVKQFKVRNADGDMVPLASVADVYETTGPVNITRYNLYTAAPINGAALPGASTGQIIEAVERLAEDQLPPTMTYEWTELAYLQQLAGGTAVFAFLGAVVLVYLVLAAQY